MCLWKIMKIKEQARPTSHRPLWSNTFYQLRILVEFCVPCRWFDGELSGLGSSTVRSCGRDCAPVSGRISIRNVFCIVSQSLLSTDNFHLGAQLGTNLPSPTQQQQLAVILLLLLSSIILWFGRFCGTHLCDIIYSTMRLALGEWHENTAPILNRVALIYSLYHQSLCNNHCAELLILYPVMVVLCDPLKSSPDERDLNIVRVE